MKSLVTAAAVTAALALTLPAAAQTTTGQTDTESQPTTGSTTESTTESTTGSTTGTTTGTTGTTTGTTGTTTGTTTESTTGSTAGATTGSVSPAESEFTVVTTAEELQGVEPAEVRVESIEEAPRDQVQAINSSLDPANPTAVQLREQIGGMEGVQEALDEEGVAQERVVGAAIDGDALVLYILPEG